MYTKFLSFLTAVCMTAAFASCGDGEYEYHATSFFPTGAGIEVYADQMVDSVRVVSYDSWSLENSCPWMQISSNGQPAPLQVTIQPGSVVSTRLDLHLTPNTTGELRTELIRVKSSFNKVGTVSKRVRQYPYIHIIQPDVNIYEQDGKKKFAFNKIVSYMGKEAGGAKPTITFFVYSDDATLTSDQEWLKPVQTEGFEHSKQQKVELDVETNMTGAPRFATLTISSNGVSTPIQIQQGENPKK